MVLVAHVVKRLESVIEKFFFGGSKTDQLKHVAVAVMSHEA